MWNKTKHDTSIEQAARRVLSPELLLARNALIDTLIEKGFNVTVKHHAWLRVKKNNVKVQLEIEPRGNNLDIVLLSDATEEMGNGFPLAGSFGPMKSSVKLDNENIAFAARRVQAFFGIVKENDELNKSVWESVKEQRSYESRLKEARKQ